MHCTLTIGCIVYCLLLNSCSNHSELLPSEDVDTFCYNDSDGIENLDPAQASTRSSMWTTTHLFNTLVEIDSTKSVVPCIAKTWSIDATGTEYTFVLRNDVYYHTDECFGSQKTRVVTAQDVKYSIERIVNAQTHSRGVWAFRKKIVGADDFHKATKSQEYSGGIRGIVVDNDTTVRIQLTKPFPPFLAVLTMPYGAIVPREAVVRYDSTFGRHPVGTGPFVLQSWTPDVEMILKRNPQYFKTTPGGERLPYLKTVQVKFLRDPKNEFLEFLRGQLDMVSQVDGSFAPSVFEANGSLQAPYKSLKSFRVAGQSIEYYGMLLDTTLPAAKAAPLAKNRLLRQALNYAIDRHRIVTYVLHGRGIPAHYGVLPPTMPGFSDTVHGYTYNPDKARQLLAAAGYPNGKGLPTLLLQLGNSQRTASVAEAVQEQWKEIGVRAELRLVDFPQHLSMVRAGDLSLWRTSWIGDYPDPENFLALFVSDNITPKGPNTTRISLPELDSLFNRALQPGLSAAERSSCYNRMERIILDESPWVFLYYDVIQRLTHPNVHNYSVDGSDRLVLENVYKTKRNLPH